MNSRKSFSTCKSFRDLKTSLEARSITLPKNQTPDLAAPRPSPENSESEEEIFQQAMEGVVPLPKSKQVERASPLQRPEACASDSSLEKESEEALSQLWELVQRGTGFSILDTPEYVEGTGYNVPSEIARRLHGGNYSVQAHVDLHGLTVNHAEEVLQRFLRWAVTTGKNGVLIIHGRGLSGPAGPVLKEKVVEWLTRGPWRKWVIAFSSARSCDGGAGATYVLLRRRPASKRMRRDRRSATAGKNR